MDVGRRCDAWETWRDDDEDWGVPLFIGSGGRLQDMLFGTGMCLCHPRNGRDGKMGDSHGSWHGGEPRIGSFGWNSMMWARNFDGQVYECEVSSLLVRLRRISKRVTLPTPCGLTGTKRSMSPNKSVGVLTTTSSSRTNPTTFRNQASHPRCDSKWAVFDFPNMRIRKYPLGELLSSISPTARTIRLDSIQPLP